MLKRLRLEWRRIININQADDTCIIIISSSIVVAPLLIDRSLVNILCAFISLILPFEWKINEKDVEI